MTEHIKIGDITPRIHYRADGRETVFSYPFPIFHAADLVVYVDDSLKTMAADYTVTGAGSDTGGTVVFTDSPETGKTVTLVRHLVIKRTSDFQESGEFRAAVINDELDRIVAMIQQTAEAIKRTVRLPATDTASAMILPPKAARAGTWLAFDDDGEPMSAVGGPGRYPATPFMARVLDDADAATARATLGLVIDSDVLSPTGDGSGLSGLAAGGPAVGTNSLYRTNAKNTRADVDISDHRTTFSIRTGPGERNRGAADGGVLNRGRDDGFLNGDPVYVSTTGTLPGGLASGTQYYVVGVTAKTLRLSASYGGQAIQISDRGTGAHTIYEAINAATIGPNTIESGVTVTVPTGSTLSITGG